VTTRQLTVVDLASVVDDDDQRHVTHDRVDDEVVANPHPDGECDRRSTESARCSAAAATGSA
jgi:hypothetical protein